ncbi:MAG: cobalt-precorrin-6A reductase [Pseudomonadota bacterium]
MRPHVLILGGTTEAAALARVLAAAGVHGTMSLAGRVDVPMRHPLDQRIGGFGGVTGLVDYILAHEVTHVVDATHPFAAQMTRNAMAACQNAVIPLLALTRPAWQPVPGDNWQRVTNIPEAVRALKKPSQNIMLAIGRMHLSEFAVNTQHHYLLRLVDPPKDPLPFPKAHVVVARGPFDETEDQALMKLHKIDLVVSKNAGGTGAYAKIAAARALGLPVLMIDRPELPQRRAVTTPEEVLAWIAHTGTDLGV